MPRLDRSGPEGKGSRTGRGQGQCNPEENMAQTIGQDAGFGRGMARRRGFQGVGRCNFMGRRGGFFQSKVDNRMNRGTPVSEQDSLKNTVDDLQRSLAEIKARLDET